MNSVEFKNAQCIQPWYYFCFNWKGNISYCCHLEHKKETGNIFEFYDYNSQKMIEFRESIIDNKKLSSCVYCQRRFMQYPQSKFLKNKKKWILKNPVNKII